MKSNISKISLALLFLLCALCSGCGPASAGGADARRAEFRISSIPKVWPGSMADTSRERRNEAHEKIRENWQRDLVVGGGSSIYADPSK